MRVFAANIINESPSTTTIYICQRNRHHDRFGGTFVNGPLPFRKAGWTCRGMVSELLSVFVVDIGERVDMIDVN